MDLRDVIKRHEIELPYCIPLVLQTLVQRLVRVATKSLREDSSYSSLNLPP